MEGEGGTVCMMVRQLMCSMDREVCCSPPRVGRHTVAEFGREDEGELCFGFVSARKGYETRRS